MDLFWQPVEPWSAPAIGMPGLAAVALALALLTLWTYVGARQATWRRVGIILTLRLAALALVFSIMLRPSFAFLELEGVENTKLLVVFDRSASMNVADADGRPSRWQQINQIWDAPTVKRRLRQLAEMQKIDVVKYLGDADLHKDEPGAEASGKRTDLGAWLHELWQKHAHEKRLRAIALFSDGADNGTRFSAPEKARAWRGMTAIHAFGAGDPANTKFKKDIGLTDLKVKTSPVAVNAKMVLEAVAQAPGLGQEKVDIVVSMENVETGKALVFKELKTFKLVGEKDQHIVIPGIAPKEPGEYKVTLKVAPHPDESNLKNNEITTFVQVLKPKINVLWVDRRRVYEPTFAIRYALAPEPRFAVRLVTLPVRSEEDPVRFYQFDQRDYDVIVIGDVTAKEFSLQQPKFLATLAAKIREKKIGLLMLGGTETFCKGGWSEHTDFMSLLPVKFDAPAGKSDFMVKEIRPTPTPDGKAAPFLRFDANQERDLAVWQTTFDLLEGISPTGGLADGATALLKSTQDELVMAATRASAASRVAVFGGDSTYRAWRDNPEAIRAYNHFWKNLIYWLAKQEDNANRLWIALDRRRLNVDAAETLGFTFGLKGKTGAELPNAKFSAEIVGPKNHAVQFAPEGQSQRGTFQTTARPGEYRLVVKATAKDSDGNNVQAESAARFMIVSEDIEMLRPAAEHGTLRRIAAESDGRFRLADEAAFVQFLDELREQVNRESRQKTVHWPDWKRLPTSESARDQLPALWSSFALVSLLLFVALICGEWSLRRWWGLV
ncbi:MAG: VWA domain-containing protein [Planctomycetes bacterium]|nr:VWA domain-containing protein [Planctomycetota bacterium]